MLIDNVVDLRLQLLEPEKYPHLYKCLYGLLMLLPQSSAFAALKNRLNSVSAIGYLHIAPRAYVSSLSHVRQKSTELKFGSTPPTPTAAFDRPNRLKAREEGAIRWVELLDKFKAVQERARRAGRSQQAHVDDGTPVLPAGASEAGSSHKLSSLLSDGPKHGQGIRPSSAGSAIQRAPPASGPMHKPKSSLGNLGRFTSGVGGMKKGKK